MAACRLKVTAGQLGGGQVEEDGDAGAAGGWWEVVECLGQGVAGAGVIRAKLDVASES